MTDTLTLECRRDAVVAASVALRDVSVVLGSASAEDLAGFLREVDALVAAGTAARIALTAAAVTSGAVRTSQAGSVAAWVATHARSQQPKGAGTIAILGQRVAQDDDPISFGIGASLLDGSLAPDAAMEVINQAERLLPVVRDECAMTVVDALVTMGTEHGPSGVRSVLPALLARFGRRDLQRDQDAAAKRVALSRAISDGMGTYLYKLTADPETKALLEAAIGPLAKPSPGLDGSPDERTLEQRRGQALREVCRNGALRAGNGARQAGNGGRQAGDGTLRARDGARQAGDGTSFGSPAAGGAHPDRALDRSQHRPVEPAPTPDARWPGPKATLILTMSLDDLIHRTGAATPMATWDQETVIAPDTVRRIACEAGVIPAVLGQDGAVLDLGRMQRFFTIDQIRALWIRDHGCTFPGCVMPPLHCDAHHIRHWIDNGPTNLTNGALLCPRHHDIVHRDRLTGTVRDATVHWDTTPGSYDQHLEQGASRDGPCGGRDPDTG